MRRLLEPRLVHSSSLLLELSRAKLFIHHGLIAWILVCACWTSLFEAVGSGAWTRWLVGATNLVFSRHQLGLTKTSHFTNFFSLTLLTNLRFNFIFSTIVDLGHILGDTVFFTKVSLGEFHSVTIRFYSLLILFQKFLLNSQIMICDSQDSHPIFKGKLCINLCILDILFSLLFLISIRHEMHQQLSLDDHNSLMCMEHCQIVSSKLGQYSTRVQMSISFTCWIWLVSFKFKGFF